MKTTIGQMQTTILSLVQGIAELQKTMIEMDRTMRQQSASIRASLQASEAACNYTVLARDASLETGGDIRENTNALLSLLSTLQANTDIRRSNLAAMEAANCQAREQRAAISQQVCI